MTDFIEKIRALSAKQLMLLALDQHERLEAASQRHESIAIVGMACRFPGAATPEAFWRLLDEGRTAIRDVPADRWDSYALFDPDRNVPGCVAIRSGGFLDDVAGFDAAFFGIAPREAASMDPQQRLLLEVTWEALENAGMPPDQLINTATGVFVGQCNTDYLQRLLWRGDAAIDGYLASGTSPSVTSGRVAYCLGLRGPALTVDTSCSSSLVALHLACRSLRSGETRVALAAGVNLICAPEATMAMSKANMLAPDGRSKAFDAAANGLGRGEGVAVLVLKRLADALADGDPVLALVRGGAVNQDGRSAGLTVPNGPAQEAVIAAALADAGVSARAIGYVEAHGTGTSLGDPIEVRALSNALGAGRTPAEPLLIGSVKSNIGHLEAAAGLAGVIKTVLCLQNGRIAPQPSFRTPNPHIPWAQIPIAVAADGAAWVAGATRLAGVSSFGFSGTNAHVVLEQAPFRTAPARDRATGCLPLNCLVLSARSPAALRALALSYAGLLEQGADLDQVARDAALGRAHLTLRLAVVAASGAAAAEALRAHAVGQMHPAVLHDLRKADGTAGAVVCFAPDFDSHAPLIGREWYGSSIVFREFMDRADALLGPDASGRRLCATLWEAAGSMDPGRARAAHLAVQCATVTLWRSFGVEPATIQGAGVGALSAAFLEGKLELAEALRRAAQDGTAPADAPYAPAGGDEVAVLGAGTPCVDEWRALGHAIGQWYVRGGSVNWRALGGTRGSTRLPNYPFDHQRYWVDIARPHVDSAGTDSGHFYEVRWKELSTVSPAAPALVTPERFIPELTRRFEVLVAQHGLEVYDRLAPLLDRLSVLHVAAALRELGFDDAPGRAFVPAEEAQRLRIVPQHQRLFTRMLEFLAADAVLCRAGDGVEVRARLPSEPARLLHDSVADTFSNAAGALRILHRCGTELAAVLTGVRDPLSLLFPEGSFAEANLLYVESPAARVYNDALGAAAVAAIAALPPGARLRVLEIGGGTGGTTHTLLPLLPADRVDYLFTDVSPLFLERALERFPTVRTGLLNIERDPAAQGFAAGNYDLVVAANVLHATADLVQTLRHVRGLLSPGGLLLCLEAVAAERWSDLTFGMTEGWWRFTDSTLRPTHALLGADTWRSLLEEVGLTQVHSIGGEPGTMAGRAQQALLIGRAPTAPRRFMLVGGGEGLAAALAARLRARGAAVSLREVDASDAAFEGADLVYLGALGLGAQTSADECTELACAAPVRWLARFGREPAVARPGRAWLVTAGAQAVQGPVSSAGRFQAPLWGVGRVCALEQPDCWGGLVDLPPEADMNARLDMLMSTLDGFGEEDQLAWRAGRAFVARLERSRGPAARGLTLRPDATYMVVGGFGGLGLLVGRWLAERGAQHIALLGRTPDMDTDGVAAIRAAGARVIPLAADVADVTSLRALLDQLAREAPPLKGIVHAATAVSVVPIAELTAPQVAAMMRPKVAGLLALQQAAPALDFLVLFSSTAALTGAMGMAHYAAANAFLDASAQQSGTGVLSVNWGSWDVIRAASEAERAALRAGGLNAVDTTHALNALGRMIAGGVRHMAMANIEWSLLKPLYEISRPRPFLAAFAAAAGDNAPRAARPAVESPRAPVAGAAAGTPCNAKSPLTLSEFLIGEIARVLGFAPGALDVDAQLADLGFDSLMAIQLRNVVTQERGLDLPLRSLLQGLSTRALVELIGREVTDVAVPQDTSADAIRRAEPAFEEGML